MNRLDLLNTPDDVTWMDIIKDKIDSTMTVYEPQDRKCGKTVKLYIGYTKGLDLDGMFYSSYPFVKLKVNPTKAVIELNEGDHVLTFHPKYHTKDMDFYEAVVNPIWSYISLMLKSIS
jgi:hypothetical protein